MTKYETKWKLNIKEGLQSWEFQKCESQEERGETNIENYLLSREANNPNSTYENEKAYYQPKEALKKSMDFMETIQNEEGFWSGDYGGPLFLLPGFLIVYYILGIVLPKEISEEMIKYLTNTQNKINGIFY
jgi:lanosterol synthase